LIPNKVAFSIPNLILPNPLILIRKVFRSPHNEERTDIFCPLQANIVIIGQTSIKEVQSNSPIFCLRELGDVLGAGLGLGIYERWKLQFLTKMLVGIKSANQ
jgi:hypothetical protein